MEDPKLIIPGDMSMRCRNCECSEDAHTDEDQKCLYSPWSFDLWTCDDPACSEKRMGFRMCNRIVRTDDNQHFHGACVPDKYDSRYVYIYDWKW